MTFNRHELDVCGVAVEEFEAMLDLLRQRIGPRITRKIEARTQLDIALINRICACAALVRELENVSGFDRVAREMARVPNASPYEPRGQWFQLLVAYIISTGRHAIALEQPVGGAPKDVVLSAENVIIECKSFDYGAREEIRLHNFLESGQVAPERSHQPDAFTTSVMPWPPPPGLPSVWISTNHYLRFVANAVDEKYGQLVDGWCNVVAFNTERISRNLHRLKEPLEKLLQPGAYRKLSGFLLVQQEALGAEDHSLRGQRFTVTLVERPAGDGVAIPESLGHSVRQWNTGGSAPGTARGRP